MVGVGLRKIRPRVKGYNVVGGAGQVVDDDGRISELGLC